MKTPQQHFRFMIIPLTAAAILFLSISCFTASPKPADPVVEAVSAATEEAPGLTVDAWKNRFPLEASTEAMNSEMKPSPTGYGGSMKFQRVAISPEIAANFKGIAFSTDYSEDRGHSYAWEDLITSKRVTAKTPGACLSCKTSDIAGIFKEQGWEYAKKPLTSLTEGNHRGIDCFSCHDPASQNLRAVQPGFIDAMKKKGNDLTQTSKNDMESYVCAQCHSEYYFEPVTTKVVFPWDKGLGAEAAWEYYSAKPSGFDGDFTHTDSGARMLKAQHPDFEEYSGGIHGQAGVSCAACHMPEITVEGKTIRSHHVTSPLKTVEASCLPCHSTRTAEWMTAQVKSRQDTVFAAQTRAGSAIAKAHFLIADAAKRKPDAPELKEARELVRKAQWFWDYTASANSMGFHNPVEALGNLSQALDSGKDAAIIASSIR